MRVDSRRVVICAALLWGAASACNAVPGGPEASAALAQSSLKAADDGPSAVEFDLAYVALPSDQTITCVAGSPNCDDYVLSVKTTGFSRHFGEVAVVQQHTAHLSKGNFTDGTLTMTTRSGRLEATYEIGYFVPVVGGTPPHPVGLFVYGPPLVVAGGDGRFEGASGKLRYWVNEDLSDRSFGAITEGLLTIPRHDD